MVVYKQIQASNALINDATAPSVAVFAGGTSGIGQFTIRALVATGASMRVYLIGRKSSADRMRTFVQELQALSSKAQVIWIEGEISLLAETKRICQVITSKESHVDLLFLTAGYAPMGGREETPEGLEITQSLEYYSRILFIQNLLPNLGRAASPRVISVLAGGLERTTVNLKDMDLKQPGSFNFIKAQAQYATMNTTTLERLAKENPDVTFIHSWPGWVNTGNVNRGIRSGSITGWLVWLFLEPLIKLFSIGDEESGQRYLFQSTSAAFGGRGVPWKAEPGLNSFAQPENGLFLVNYKCDCTSNSKVMAALREEAQSVIWAHTQEVLGPYI